MSDKRKVIRIDQLPESTRQAFELMARQFELPGDQEIAGAKEAMAWGLMFYGAVEAGLIPPGDYDFFIIDENGAITTDFTQEE